MTSVSAARGSACGKGLAPSMRSHPSGVDVIGDLVVVRNDQPMFRDVRADSHHQVLFDESYA